MMNAQADLGQRIVEAARLAMLMHLSQLRQEAEQQNVNGGAGARFSKDGELPAKGDRFGRSPDSAEGEAS